jgi:hypothetical protein
MRYRDTGNVHKDFHLATNTSIQFVLRTYGMEFLRELFRRTAQEVYRDIYDSLKRGEWKPLLEHWTYYYEREQGKYEVTPADGGFIFLVQECPAVRHLRERSIPVTSDFALQETLMNDGWSAETPFQISTEILGEGSYRFSVLPRARRTPQA